MQYHWPGNVRELENMVRRMVVLGNEQAVLDEISSRALGEKGTLATQDVKRALDAVPDFGDTQQSAQAKIRQLEQFMGTVEKKIQQLRPGLEGRSGGPSGAAPEAPPPSNKQGKGWYEMNDGSRKYWDGGQWQNSRP